MSTVEEIKAAIATLSPDQRAELEDWLVQSQQEDDDWDRQMRADVKAGRLDTLLEQVDREIDQGKTRDLP